MKAMRELWEWSSSRRNLDTGPAGTHHGRSHRSVVGGHTGAYWMAAGMAHLSPHSPHAPQAACTLQPWPTGPCAMQPLRCTPARLLSPHSCSKKWRTSALCAALSMLVTYTVRAVRSTCAGQPRHVQSSMPCIVALDQGVDWARTPWCKGHEELTGSGPKRRQRVWQY